ncbi:NmrA family NAD(P)-binding protein [Pseudoduganella sp. FT55W]|uniref:NmrA family NAD(P)-binding protein n=1 Tax=Duganella rivi TaxID=2666083 RepID=A0A7X4GKY7_9BURK|nr:NmrA family NAD(P)-binding protein [Duganella rivi]MYM65397.1 NmrA family NAD(P)-binding protein [Duganella rivi]
MNKILVTGASGHLGKAIIKALLKHLPAQQVVASARDPEQAAELSALGVEVRRADYTDFESMLAALQGIDKLFLVSAVAFSDRLAQHANVIRAAQAAGVRHIVYPSIQRRDGVTVGIEGVTDSDIATEQLLRASGMAYTIVQHPLYAESIPVFVGDRVATSGIRVPAGDGRIPLTSRDDLAAASAAILAQDGHENTEVSLNAGSSYSMHDLAAAYAELLATPVSYTAISPAEYAAEREAAGLPAPVAAFFNAWWAAIAAGAFDQPDPALQRLTGAPAKSLRQVLASAL